MKLSDILRVVGADGVDLQLDGANSIDVTGEEPAVLRWLPLIRTHKPAIVAILKDEKNDADIQHCSECKHGREPGRVRIFFCVGRDDLMPAYGPNHPLRE